MKERLTLKRYCWLGCFSLLLTLTSAEEVLFSVPISVGGVPKSLELYRGQSYESAAFDFAKNNQLFETYGEANANNVVSQLVEIIQNKLQEQQEVKQTIAFTLPVFLDGTQTEMEVYNGRTPEESIRAYFDKYQIIAEEIRANIAPQLLQLIQNKVNELQQQQQQQQQPIENKVMFTIPITIDNQQIYVQHMENGNIFDEARRTLLGAGITSIEVLQNLIPQIANILQQRLEELTKPKTVLFSIPITIDNREVLMPHYAEQSAQESVVQFLQTQGVTDSDTINRYAPALINMIDQYIQQNINRKPLVAIGVQVNGRKIEYEYFEGEDPRRSVINFLQRIGITEEQVFLENLNIILRALVERLNANQQPTAAKEEKVVAVLPVQLGNNVYNLQMLESQNSRNVAESFCKEHWVAIKQQLGEAFTEQDLVGCINVIDNNLQEKLRETTSSEGASSPSAEDAAVPEHETSNIAEETSSYDVVQGNNAEDSSESLLVEEGEITMEKPISKRDEVTETEQSAKAESIVNKPTVEETVTEEESQATATNTTANIEDTINTNIIEDQEETESATPPSKVLKPLKLRPKKQHLFTLNVDLGDGNVADLSYYQDEDPKTVAEKFCMENSIDLENVSVLTDMIESQIH